VIYVILGSLGFLVIHLLDIASLKRIPGLKPLTLVAGNGLVVYAAVMACLASDKLSLPPWVSWLGWVLLPASLFMLVYSLFLNLPFKKTYVSQGAGPLVTGGLYALVRHPWVYWLILAMLALVLASGSSLMLIAAPIWVGLDVILVAIQDRFFFGKMFADYDSYRRRTPMLIPNRRSLSAFIHSLKQGGGRTPEGRLP
jgi:protein-S-isoprenylcysteine O-methyltransferase Ste14